MSAEDWNVTIYETLGKYGHAGSSGEWFWRFDDPDSIVHGPYRSPQDAELAVRRDYIDTLADDPTRQPAFQLEVSRKLRAS